MTTASNNTRNIKINDEYANLVLPLTKFEYERLKESIKEANGLDYAIVVNKDNVILDGHHRFKACQELGIEPKIEVKEFPSPLDEKLFVIRSNKDRRQLNSFQLIELELKTKSILEEQAKKNMSDASHLSASKAVSMVLCSIGLAVFT